MNTQLINLPFSFFVKNKIWATSGFLTLMYFGQSTFSLVMAQQVVSSDTSSAVVATGGDITVNSGVSISTTGVDSISVNGVSVSNLTNNGSVLPYWGGYGINFNSLSSSATITNNGNIGRINSSHNTATGINLNSAASIINNGSIDGSNHLIFIHSGASGSSITNNGTIGTKLQDYTAISIDGGTTVSSLLNASGATMKGVVGIVNSGTITELINYGAIYSAHWVPANAIYGGGAIANLVNYGTISGANGGMAIGNTVVNLANAQGAARQNPLTIINNPTNYSIIINSPTSYGQLSVQSMTGAMGFSIYSGSVVRSGFLYASVLRGVDAPNLGTTSGVFGGSSWALSLASGSSAIWDLCFGSNPCTTSLSTDITSGSSGTLSAVGSSLNPVFDGGALALINGDHSNETFTVNSTGGTISSPTGGSAILSGVFSGAGALTFNGSGTTYMNGVNTYTGGTTVTGGTLVVTGEIGAVAVTSGTLQGTGTVGTATIASGSTLSPGVNGAPGTLNVSGNLTMAAGSNYVVAVTPTAASQVNVSGSAHVNGAVRAIFTASNYHVGQRFTIVDPPGLVTGTFTSLTDVGLPVYLTDNLSYTSNYVYLNIAPKYLTPLLPAGSPTNLTNTATAIDAAVTAGGIPSTGMLALYSQTGATLAGSITQAEGQVGANVATAVTQSFAPFLKTMTDQCTAGSDQDASTSCAWSSVYGGHTGIAANVTTGAASLSGSNVGLAVGGQMNVAELDAILGASLAYGQQTFSSGNGTGTSRDILLGIYANKTIMDRGYISASLGYGILNVTTTRNITVSGTDVLSGKVNAHEFGGRVEGGYHFSVEDQYGLTPYLAGSFQNIVTPAYAEGVQSGTSSFAVSYLSQKNTFGRIEAGTHLERSFQLDDDTNLTAQGTIGWSHQLGYSPVSTVSFQSLSGSSFLLNGIRPANDTAVLGLNLQAHKATGLSYGVRLDSQLGSGTTILEAAGNVAYRW